MGIALIVGIGAAAGAAAFTASIALIAGAFVVGAALGNYVMEGMVQDQEGIAGTNATVREPAVTRKVIYGEARTGGAIVFIDSSGTDNKYLHLVIAFAGHEIESYEKIYFDDRLVWSGGSYQGDWADYAELNFHKGDQTAADSNLVSRAVGWNSDNKLLGTAYIYARLTYDQEELNGVPNISAVIKGKKVYNPITAQTAYSTNPALCIRDYLLDSKYGLGEVSANIDSASLTAAINKCDENIALSAGGTEKRYTCNGILDTGRSRKSNIRSLLKCMGGKLVYSGDKYFIVPAYYTTPVMTIDESLLAGDVKIRTKQSRRQLYNGVKGTYVSKENNYIVSDYPAQISSTYEAEDGDPIYMDLQLPFVATNTQAQRLAKIALLQSRQQQSITLPCNLAALKFKAGDNIQVTYAKMGYSSKVFEVQNYSIKLDKSGQIIVDVEAIETASAIYDWNTSDEEDFLAAGEIDLYNGSVAEPPTSLSLAKSTTINDDGTAIENIVATWTASADVFVDKYEVEWSTDNTVFTGVVTDGTRFTIENVIAAQTYYVRVRGVNNLGVKSTYATANITASGDTTAPAVPTGLTATPSYQQIRLNWTNPSDNDFSHVEIQRREAGDTFASIASVSGGRGEAAEFVSAGLDDETEYFHRIRSVDYSGNTSAYVTAVSATTEAAPETPRTNHGYVYYALASATQPSTPTATSYNYDTNTFSGLTSGWVVDPPTVDADEDKYWAASFTVTEATHGGTQTITFSTPFVSHFFDGLVNFTNLNDEISDSASTRITTINGGLIKTGLVEADRIKVDDSTIDTGLVGGVQALKIKNLGVETIHIGDNQVTVPNATRNQIFDYQSSGSTYELLEDMTITVTGAPIQTLNIIRLEAGNSAGTALATSGKVVFDFRTEWLTYDSGGNYIGTVTSGVENSKCIHSNFATQIQSNLFFPSSNVASIKVESRVRVTSTDRTAYIGDAFLSTLEVKK
jgi:hypothetical protein